MSNQSMTDPRFGGFTASEYQDLVMKAYGHIFDITIDENSVEAIEARKMLLNMRAFHEKTKTIVGFNLKKRVIYLSGPMTGLPDFNYPAFATVSKKLRDAGHRVYSPHEFPHDGKLEDFPVRKAFASFSNFICLEADTIVMLKDWDRGSRGAMAEHALAQACSLKVFEWEYMGW